MGVNITPSVLAIVEEGTFHENGKNLSSLCKFLMYNKDNGEELRKPFNFSQTL